MKQMIVQEGKVERILTPISERAKSSHYLDALALTFSVRVARPNIKKYNSYNVTSPVGAGVTESFFDEINA